MRQHVGIAEMVDARVAGVHDIAVTRGADEKGGDGAVRLLFRRDRGQLDHQVRFHHQLLERLRWVVAARRVALEQLLGGEQHLVGGLAAAALAAHAVGEHAEQAAGSPVMRNDLDLVLLVGAVAAMQARRGGQTVSRGGCAHGRKL